MRGRGEEIVKVVCDNMEEGEGKWRGKSSTFSGQVGRLYSKAPPPCVFFI